MPETSLILRAKDFTKQAFNQIQQSLDKTTDYFEKLAKESKQTEHGITGSLNRLKNSLQANQEGFQAIAIGAGAVAAATGLLTKEFIGAAMTMEKMKMGLIAVMGSSEDAEKQLVRLKEVAKLPGLGLQEAIQGAVRLQVVGTSAEDAAKQLTAFGGAVARAGGGRGELARVVEQIAQMSAKGKVLTEDFRPIVSLMPDIVTAMDKAFGTKQIDQIREMGVDSQQFIAGITTELLKMPGVGQTAANSIENLSDTIFELKASLGEALLPTVSKVIDTIAKVVSWFNKLSDTQKAVLAWGTAITAGLATLAAAGAGILMMLPGLITGITTLSTVVIPKLIASLAFLSGVGGPIVATVAALGLLTVAVYKLQDGLKRYDMAKEIGNLVKGLDTLGNIASAQKIEEYDKALERMYEIHAKLSGREANIVKQNIDKIIAKREELMGVLTKEMPELITRAKPLQPAARVAPQIAEDLSSRELALRQQEIQLIEDKYDKEFELAVLARDKNVTKLKKELEDEKKTAEEKSIIRKQILAEEDILRKEFTDINMRALEERKETERKAQEELNKIKIEFSDKYILAAKQSEKKRLNELHQLQLENAKSTIALIENTWIKRHATIDLEYQVQKGSIEEQLNNQLLSLDKRAQLERQLSLLITQTRQEHAEIDKERNKQEQQQKEEAQNTYLASIKATSDARIKNAENITSQLVEIDKKIALVQIENISDDYDRRKALYEYKAELAKSEIENEEVKLKTLKLLWLKYASESSDIHKKLIDDVMSGWKKVTEEQPKEQNVFYADMQRNVENFVDRASSIFSELPFNMAEAFITGKQTVGDAIKDFFIDIGQLIMRETQKIIAMKVAEKIMQSQTMTSLLGTATTSAVSGGGAASIAGGLAGAGGGIASLLGGIAPFALPALMGGIVLRDLGLFNKLGFDNPQHDAIARSAGFMRGISFDNPNNDLRAQLRGTMTASQELGERSARDMVSHFSTGFEQGASGKSADNNELKNVLGRIEQRLGETPQLRIYLGDREITATVRREMDKQNIRGTAY